MPQIMTDNLAADGYQPLSAETREQALAVLACRPARLVIADVNGETLGLLDAIRGGGGLRDRIDPDVPFVVLSERADELARVRALERGADDVLAKPFSYPELRARIRAVIRRCYEDRRQLVRFGALVVDRTARRVWVGEHEVELSAKEFELLAVLAAEPERVYTKEELLSTVWGLGSWARTRTLESHIISSPEMAVDYVDCGFRPTRRRRFISSGVDSALAAELSPEGEAPWRGRCAPTDHLHVIESWPPRTSLTASRCRTGGRRGRCSAPMVVRSRQRRGSCGICTGSSARRHAPRVCA
jgi:DNA-binding response OmpR family regulator